MPAKVVWNPPAVQLALWKSYLDKNKGSIRKAHSQIPDPKPSYIAFMKICNTAFGLSPLQAARQKNRSVYPEFYDKKTEMNNNYGKVVKALETVQPIKTAPPVPINGIHPKKDESSDKKIVELIWSAIKANNMNGDEFKGFVKGLLTMNELK